MRIFLKTNLFIEIIKQYITIIKNLTLIINIAVSFKIQKQSLNLKKHNNLILFVDSNFEVKGLEDSLLSKNLSLINKMIGLNKKKIKNFFSFDLSLNLKIIIVKVNLKGKNFENIEKLGAKFFEYVKSNSFYETAILNQNIKFFSRKDLSFFDKFIFGIFIKSYQFDVYKTSLEKKLFKLSIQKNFNYNFYLKHNKFISLVEVISFTKNLVSEPRNMLHPD